MSLAEGHRKSAETLIAKLVLPIDERRMTAGFSIATGSTRSSG